MTFSFRVIFAAGLSILAATHATLSSAQVSDALTGGKASGSFNLRYESVDQDNALDDAQALTLSSKLSYTTGTVNGFSAMIEVEDVRIVSGIDSYSVGPSGFNPGRYSVIADPETTELDQAFLRYNGRQFTAILGRQVIVYDNHRFIGPVGWRQDRQTFDAVSMAYTLSDKLSLKYDYLDQRNRIFAEDADVDSSDHIIHADYQTSFGTVTAYGYLLETDVQTLDTLGFRLSGSSELANTEISYQLEYANQESSKNLAKFEAHYSLVEIGAELFGGITAKLGYEKLGSDNGLYGFSTPLATLHIMNGWSDSFLTTPNGGLIDNYLSIGTKLFNSNLALVYHDFEASDSVTAADDLGWEWNLQWVLPITENYTLGLKYAAYAAGDSLNTQVDTDKLWAWFKLSF